MKPATLPPYDPATSDGCSVPRWLRWLLPIESDESIEVCRIHDEAYYYGGPASIRKLVDLQFYYGHLKAGMPKWKALVYYYAVRIGGHPRFRQKGISWAFGSERFRYISVAEYSL